MSIKSQVKNKVIYSLKEVTSGEIAIGNIVKMRSADYKLVDINSNEYSYRKVGKASAGFMESKAKNSLVTLSKEEHLKVSKKFYEIVEKPSNKKTLFITRVDDDVVKEDKTIQKSNLFNTVKEDKTIQKSNLFNDVKAEVAIDLDEDLDEAVDIVTPLESYQSLFKADTEGVITQYKKWMPIAVKQKSFILAHTLFCAKHFGKVIPEFILEGMTDKNCLSSVLAVELGLIDLQYVKDIDFLIKAYKNIIQDKTLAHDDSAYDNTLRPTDEGFDNCIIFNALSTQITDNALTTMRYTRDKYFNFINICEATLSVTKLPFVINEYNSLVDNTISKFTSDVNRFKITSLTQAENNIGIDFIIKGISVLAKNLMAINNTNYKQLECESVYKLIDTINDKVKVL